MAKQRRNAPKPITSGAEQDNKQTKLFDQIGHFTGFMNWYIDTCMHLLSGDMHMVYSAINRKTIGYKDDETGKQKESDRIAYSQLADLTGLSDDALCRSLDALKRYRLVLTDGKKPGRKGTEYTIQLDPSQVDFAAMQVDAAERAARNARKTAKARNAPRDETRNTRVYREKNTPVPLTDEELNTLVDREQSKVNALYTREQKPANRLVSRATIETLIETSSTPQRVLEEETIDTAIHSDKSEFIGLPLAFSPSGETQSATPLAEDETKETKPYNMEVRRKIRTTLTRIQSNRFMDDRQRQQYIAKLTALRDNDKEDEALALIADYDAKTDRVQKWYSDLLLATPGYLRDHFLPQATDDFNRRIIKMAIAELETPKPSKQVEPEDCPF